FVECLASLLGRLGEGGDGRKPTLVLNGDILELALARDDVALGVFTQFLELAFERHDLFDPVIVYLPGNHDHKLWSSRHDPKVSRKATNGSNGFADASWSANLFDQNGARNGAAKRTRAAKSDVLTSAAHRREGLKHLQFEMRYPTYAVESESH